MAAAMTHLGCMEPRQPLDDLDIPPCPARLLPGDLVITEIMPNPADATNQARADDGPTGEWIEIHNPMPRTLDLEGVVIGTGNVDTVLTRHALDSTPIAPGEYLVIGRLADSASSIPAGGPAAPLPAQGGRVTMHCDVIELDSVTYPAVTPGVAHGFSGALTPDAAANDEPGTWCAATRAFAPGRLGSPGAANEPCPDDPGGDPDGGPDDGPGDPGDPDSGMCDDNGTMRARIVPAPGDLVIAELMPNPAAAADADGEWIELHASADVDLNGLAVGREPGTSWAVLDSGACLFAPQGSLVLIAASADAAINGGLPAVDHAMDLSLVNSNGGLFIGVGDTVLDRITWAASSAGASLSLDPDALSPEANDAPTSWCPSPGDAYGNGDTGTPGADNPPCPTTGP